MAIACQSESQPAEMHQLPAQLPSLPRSPSPHLARSFGCEIEIISSSWAPSLAWPAAVARRTRIILSSRSSGRLVAKLVMSLPYHCAVLTIANSINAATNAYGGNNLTSIRCLLRRGYGRPQGSKPPPSPSGARILKRCRKRNRGRKGPDPFKLRDASDQMIVVADKRSRVLVCLCLEARGVVLAQQSNIGGMGSVGHRKDSASTGLICDITRGRAGPECQIHQIEVVIPVKSGHDPGKVEGVMEHDCPRGCGIKRHLRS